MGRRKIKIERISENRTRNVTFHKRKLGVMKKAHELSVLCGADVAFLVMYEGKAAMYCSGNLDQVIAKFAHHRQYKHVDVRSGKEFQVSNSKSQPRTRFAADLETEEEEDEEECDEEEENETTMDSPMVHPHQFMQPFHGIPAGAQHVSSSFSGASSAPSPSIPSYPPPTTSGFPFMKAEPLSFYNQSPLAPSPQQHAGYAPVTQATQFSNHYQQQHHSYPGTPVLGHASQLAARSINPNASKLAFIQQQQFQNQQNPFSTLSSSYQPSPDLTPQSTPVMQNPHAVQFGNARSVSSALAAAIPNDAHGRGFPSAAPVSIPPTPPVGSPMIMSRTFPTGAGSLSSTSPSSRAETPTSRMATNSRLPPLRIEIPNEKRVPVNASHTVAPSRSAGPVTALLNDMSQFTNSQSHHPSHSVASEGGTPMFGPGLFSPSTANLFQSFV